MDEPLGALDAEFRNLMCQELKGLHDRIEATTVYVTHDQLEAMAMADRIAVMKDGRIIETGTADRVLREPEALYTQTLLSAVPSTLRALADRQMQGIAHVN